MKYRASGSAAVVPALKTLRTGTETMKKVGKPLRLCLAVGAVCLAVWVCDSAHLRKEQETATNRRGKASPSEFNTLKPVEEGMWIPDAANVPVSLRLESALHMALAAECLSPHSNTLKPVNVSIDRVRKATEGGDGNAKKCLARATREQAALTAREAPEHSDATPVEEATMLAQAGEVLNAYPDGLVIEYNGGTILRKVKFKDLPESIQQRYRYDPQEAAEYEANQAEAAAEYRAEQKRKAAELRARQEAVARDATDREQGKIAILSQIVSDYHKSHTYSKQDCFVCGDMACDVWNIVKTKGIEAKIEVGSVDRDITSLREADHAWVLAEISPGEWLALETTAGCVVYPQQNPRYYWGWSFDNPKKFKEFNYWHLYRP